MFATEFSRDEKWLRIEGFPKDSAVSVLFLAKEAVPTPELDFVVRAGFSDENGCHDFNIVVTHIGRDSSDNDLLKLTFIMREALDEKTREDLHSVVDQQEFSRLIGDVIETTLDAMSPTGKASDSPIVCRTASVSLN